MIPHRPCRIRNQNKYGSMKPRPRLVHASVARGIMDCWASLEHLAEYKQVIDLTPDVLDLLETYRQAADREIALLGA